MNLAAFYVIIGFLVLVYVVLAHLYATWKYIKQLYTAKYVEPKKIKTYFGFKYWSWSNNDSWIEIVGVSTLVMFLWALVSFIAWPLTVIFFLNNSIEKARERIENGD